MDPAKSGGCALDLHIHDADFILHCFGYPETVSSHGVAGANGRNDLIMTAYQYADDMLAVAEGAWGYPPSYPFSMTFSIAMEQATLRCNDQMQLTLHPMQGEPRVLTVDAEDGYFHELSHFVACINRNEASQVVSPASAADSIALIHAEMQSLQEHRPITPSFPAYT
jgi:predicted dehydrogenase